MRRRTPGLRRSLVAVALGLAACGDGPAGPEGRLAGDEATVLFLAQGVPATSAMQALWDGDVVVDDAGCIRLGAQAPDNSTVVWPHRFTLSASGRSVLDAAGAPVGDLGGRFRLGGGHVPDLWTALGFTEAQVATIRARCPGSYWLVGEIPGR